MNIQDLHKLNQDRRDKGVKTNRELNPIKRLEANPKSRKLAINACCFQCFGGTVDTFPDPGWKREIRDCTSPGCALFAFRPYQKKGGE